MYQEVTRVICQGNPGSIQLVLYVVINPRNNRVRNLAGQVEMLELVDDRGGVR